MTSDHHDDLFVVMMLDPDDPSAADPSNRSWLHWLVVNVPLSEIASASGDTLCPFVSSGPAKGSGLHRYVLAVFRQGRGRISTTARWTMSEMGDQAAGVLPRVKFDIASWAQQHHLTLEAANFYLAEYDPHVDKVLAALL